MKRMILTANGLENRVIGEKFLKMANKEPSQIKMIFVPTAANDAGAIEFLPGCLHDLLDLGIPKENILVYDLHFRMEYRELIKYDGIYFCGGSESYLLDRINKSEFRNPLMDFVESGGIYIGVSAGSVVAANNLPNNLGYLNLKLDVHGNEGIGAGKIEPTEYSYIKLPDNRAIIIEGNNYEVIG